MQQTEESHSYSVCVLERQKFVFRVGIGGGGWAITTHRGHGRDHAVHTSVSEQFGMERLALSGKGNLLVWVCL